MAADERDVGHRVVAIALVRIAAVRMVKAIVGYTDAHGRS